MRYENFENKIKKIAKVNLFFYKTRFVWLGITLAGAIAITALNFVKGKITGEYNIPEEIIYGESYNPKASASFNSAYIEYSLASENNYSKNKPYLVGEYKARGVSKNGYGAKTYGDVYNFEIKKKPIEFSVKQSTITYGDSLSINSETVNSGDHVSNYTLNYDDKSSHTPTISIDESSLIINNDKGENVTYCYDITLTDKKITINNRDVYIAFASASKEYDGESISGDYSISGLLEGDELSFSEECPTLSELGSIDNVIKSECISIENKDGDDVTDFYNCHITAGELSVTQRSLTITSSSINRDYNGYALVSNSNNSGELNYSITAGTLLSNHHIEISYANEGKYASFSTKNSFDVTIRDQNNNDVSKYYSITKISGNLTINKLPITLTTKSINQTYDDKEYSVYFENEGEYIKSGKLCDTDYLSLDSDIPALKDPINERVNDLNIVIKNRNIESFAMDDCYDVTYEYGTVAINKIDISLSTNNLSFTYDGEKISKDSTDLTHKLQLNIDSGSILPSHKLIYEFDNEGKYSVFSGKNTLKSWDIVDENNKSVKDSYYSYSLSIGSLSISKKALTIKANDNVKNTFMWGDPEHDLTKNEITVSGLCESDEFIFHSTSEKRTSEIGDYERIMILGKDYEIKRISSDEDASSNYEIDSSNLGNFSITKRPLTIYSNTINRTYNGKKLAALTTTSQYNNLSSNLDSLGSENALYCTISQDTKANLLAGHEITYTFDHDGEFISTSNSNKKNTFTLEIYDTTNHVYVTDKYEITAIYGDCIINKAPLSLLTGDLSKIYDGTELKDNNKPTADGLIGSDELNLNLSTHSSQTDVGSTDNKWVGYSITNYNYSFSGEDVTSCYDINVDWGTLSVDKREIVVTMPSYEVTYDGTLHTPKNSTSYSSPILSGGSLASDQYLDYKDFPTYWQAGEYDNDELSNNYTAKIVSSDGTIDYSSNYDITYIYSPIKIDKRNYSFSYKSDALYKEYDYDGTTLESKYDINEDPLEYFSFTGQLASYDSKKLYYIDELSFRPTKGETKTASIGIKIANSNPSVLSFLKKSSSIESTSNYNINPNSVTASYKINALTLEITPGSGSKMYDGTEPSLENVNGIYSYSGIPATYTVSGIKPYIEFQDGQTNSFEAGEYVVKYDLSNLVIKNESGTVIYDAQNEELNDTFFIFMNGETGTYSISKRQTTLYFDSERFISDTSGYSNSYNDSYVSSEKTYDSESYNISDYFSFSGNQIADTDKYSFKSFNDAYFMATSYSGDWIQDDDFVTITHKSGIDVTSSYELIHNFDYDFTIDKRDITISGYPVKKTFDNKKFSKSDDSNFQEAMVYSGSLGINDSFKSTFIDNSYIDAGVYSDSFVVKITNSNGSDVTDCYSISKYPGTVTIDPRIIYYRCNSASATYSGVSTSIESGTEITDNNKDMVYFSSSDYEFLNSLGYSAIVYYGANGEYVNPGKYTVSVTVSIIDENGNVYTGNNIVSKAYGSSGVTITINKRKATIKVAKQDYFWCEYDSEGNISSSDYTGFDGTVSFTVTGIASGQSVSGTLSFNLKYIPHTTSENEYGDIVYTYSAFDIESYLKTIISDENSQIIILDKDGNDVTSYYYFVYDCNEIVLWS